MSEKANSLEALSTLPLKDVILTPSKGLRVLSKRTKKAVKHNLNHYTNANIATARKIAKRLPSQGFFFTKDSYQTMLDSFGQSTFFDLCVYGLDNVFPTSFENDNENPGTTLIGYFLDLLKIIKPKVTSYDKAVSTIVETVRHTNFSLFTFGAAIDDSIHLRGTEDNPLELLMDIEEVRQFEEVFVQHLNPGEKIEYLKGRVIDKDELIMRIHGFSIN